MPPRIQDYITRLKCRDPTLKEIHLIRKNFTDAEAVELVDCLLAYSASVTTLDLYGNQLTNETGIKLAQYIASSSTITYLNLSDNQFTEKTYLAVAAALCINSSLKFLYLHDNLEVDETRIDYAFIKALRLNPERPTTSCWFLWPWLDDFARLRDAAKEQEHPTLQMILSIQLELKSIHPIKR